MTAPLSAARIAEIKALLEPFDIEDLNAVQDWRIDAKHAIRVLLAERERGDPDFVYEIDAWECTYAWADRDKIEDSVRDNVDPGVIVEVGCLRKMPERYIVASFDEEHGTRTHWFDTREGAEQFARAQMEPPSHD